MDTVRYFLALLLLVILPPSLLFWLLIHPFVDFWRKVGPVGTYCAVGAVLAAGMAGLFLVRRPLLATEFGTSYPLILAGGLCLAVAARLRVLLHRHVSNKLLAGLPELDPVRYPVKLVTEGLYARVRHPRYAQFALALLGYALLANYLAAYLTVALWLPGLWVITMLEERELRNRYGKEYEEYCRRVPRFVPRLSQRA